MVKFLKNQVKAIDSSKIFRHDNKVELTVVQQPVKARVSGRKETRNSSRRLVDPQPVVQLKLEQDSRNVVDYSVGIYFIRASIDCIGFADSESFMAKQRKSKMLSEPLEEKDILRGTTAVTAQFYKGSPYVACGIFDNLSVRFKGDYRLRFDLYEVQSFTDSNAENGATLMPKIVHWENATVYTSKFTVYTDSSFDGLEASPMLNEQLKKAGCRIRTRKPKANMHNGLLGRMPFDNGFRIAKSINNYPYYPNNNLNHQLATAYYNNIAPLMPAYSNSNGYFDSSVTRYHLPAVTDIYSKVSTPGPNCLSSVTGTPLSAVSPRYYTPTRLLPLTPQSQGIEVASSPLTHTVAGGNDNGDDNGGGFFGNTDLNLSPLEQEALFNQNNSSSSYQSSNYVLSSDAFSENSTKLDIDSLDSFYQTLSSDSQAATTNNNNTSSSDFVPRATDVFLEPLNGILNGSASTLEPQGHQQQYVRESDNNDYQNNGMDLVALLKDSINFSAMDFSNQRNSTKTEIQNHSDHQQQQQQPVLENAFAINDLNFTF